MNIKCSWPDENDEIRIKMDGSDEIGRVTKAEMIRSVEESNRCL